LGTVAVEVVTVAAPDLVEELAGAEAFDLKKDTNPVFFV